MGIYMVSLVVSRLDVERRVDGLAVEELSTCMAS